jgi:hypothetical protein
MEINHAIKLLQIKLTHNNQKDGSLILSLVYGFI